MNLRLSITCPKCGKSFKEQPTKIRAGVTLACPKCPTPIAVDPAPENDTVRKALVMARRFRLEAARS
jgi:DNA-directed RNA polymerase subunit RPC12/RpoP